MKYRSLALLSALVLGAGLTAWGATMAASTLFALPALIIFLALQRHVTAGLAPGGVKG